MSVVMRNRVTTEYRKVDADSEEFYALRAELHTDGRPRWEQTGEHDLQAYLQRQEAGVERNSDLGDADQPADVINTMAPADAAVGLDRGYPKIGRAHV